MSIITRAGNLLVSLVTQLASDPTGPSSRVMRVIPLDQFGNVVSGGAGGSSAGGAAYQSPGDFAAAYASATTLDLSQLPFPPLFEQFEAVAEYDGDNLIALYAISDTDHDWTWTPGADTSAGVLSIAGATFDAASTFVVQLRGPERDELDVLTDFSGPYVHQSPRDFDVAHASATTLDFGGVTAMAMDPDVDDIRAVVEIAAGGRVRAVYTRREWAFTWAAGAAGEGVLTIAGATMQATSTFIAFVEGPEHGTQAANAGAAATDTVKRVQHRDGTGAILQSLSSLATAGFIRLSNGTIEALLSAANTARAATDNVLSVQHLDASGAVPPAGDAVGNAPFSKLTDGTNTAAMDPADTARTTATVVQATQNVDATGKVSPAGEANTNAPFVKLTDGSQDADFKQADTAPTTSTIVLPTQHVDEAGKVQPAGEDAASAVYMRLLGMMGNMSGDGMYVSPIHFTATQNAATEIDLAGGFPGIIDVSQILLVTQISNAGVVTVFYPHTHVFAWDAANSRITVTGATFAGTDVFGVVIRGANRYANDPGNFKNTAEVLPYPLRTDDRGIELITAAQAFTNAWADIGPEIPMHGYGGCAFYFTLDINDDKDLRFRVLGKHESAGAEEYLLPIKSVTTGVVNVQQLYVEFTEDDDQLIVVDVETAGRIPYLQGQILRGTDGGGTDAEVDAAYYVRGMGGVL